MREEKIGGARPRAPLMTGAGLTPAGRRLALAAALIWAAAIAYGSLLPFEFRDLGLAQAVDRFLNIRTLNITAGLRADWVANILLYIPLTLLLSAAWMAPGRFFIARTLAAPPIVAIGVALAFAVEFAQIFTTGRTVSTNDLMAESIGAGLGAMIWLALGPAAPAISDRLRMGGVDAFATLFAFYVVIYGLYALFPFDFVVTGDEVLHSLARAGDTLFGLPGGPGGTADLAFWAAATVVAGAPIGALLRLTNERFNPGAAFFIGLAIALGLELAQILLVSGDVYLASAPLTGLGAASGAMMVAIFEGRPAWRWRELARLALPILFLLYIPFAIAAYDLFGAPWADPGRVQANLEDLKWTPFYYHYFTTELQAVRSLVARAAVFAPIGLMVWLGLGAPARARGAVFAGVGAAALAAGLETARLMKVDLRPDMTNILIAFAAAWAAARLAPAFAGWLEASAARRRRL